MNRCNLPRCALLLKQVCQQYVLHPHNATEAQAHRDECGDLAAKLAKRVRDSTIECGICLEKVLTRPEMSQRRFGLMACEHAFCLNCIRNWRATGEVDAKTVSGLLSSVVLHLLSVCGVSCVVYQPPPGSQSRTLRAI